MSKAAKVVSRFNITVPAGKASPQPPVGSALGQRGLKLMDFCKAFNDQTSKYVEGTPMPCRVTSFADRTFTFTVLNPPTSYFLKKAAGLQKGATRPGHEKVGRVTVKHVYEIAKLKMEDVEKKGARMTLQTLAKSIVGSARSMGIEVVGPSPSEVPADAQKR